MNMDQIVKGLIDAGFNAKLVVFDKSTSSGSILEELDDLTLDDVDDTEALFGNAETRFRMAVQQDIRRTDQSSSPDEKVL